MTTFFGFNFNLRFPRENAYGNPEFERKGSKVYTMIVPITI